jgi:hypothetical protein
MGGGSGPDALGIGSEAAMRETVRLLQRMHPTSSGGYFGRRSPGKSVRIRLLESHDPDGAARRFFAVASRRGTQVSYKNGQTLGAKFGDAGWVIYRSTSSDGSPAVSIEIRTTGVGLARSQKIHFVRRQSHD